MARRMTRWQARAIIARLDPQRAKKCNEVDPLELEFYCNCDNPSYIDISDLADAQPVQYCTNCRMNVEPLPEPTNPGKVARH